MKLENSKTCLLTVFFLNLAWLLPASQFHCVTPHILLPKPLKHKPTGSSLRFPKEGVHSYNVPFVINTEKCHFD